MNDEEWYVTYVTSAFIEECVVRQAIQHLDDGSEPLEQFGIAPLEFSKLLCLFFEYMKDVIRAAALSYIGGEWVIAKIFSCLPGVLPQGSIKKGVKVGGRGGHGTMGMDMSRALSGREGEQRK